MVGLVGSIGLGLGLVLGSVGLGLGLYCWTLWHRGGTLNVWPKMPTYFLDHSPEPRIK